jgi:acetaldehyde dehydrogenase
MMAPAKVAIIGSGNIGTDLLLKVLQRSQRLSVAAFVGIDPASEGLARAARLGVATTSGGIEALLERPDFSEVKIVFDATSAAAHRRHAALLAAHGKQVIDLTPAAIGPYVVPPVNLDEHLAAPNVNLVTCGGQATIPIVAAVSQVARPLYAEIVSAIASKSAGPGTRNNIDEFTRTTARGLEVVGGATRGKAIIVLNPAEPPILMRTTVSCFVPGRVDQAAVEHSVEAMIRQVQRYVPGYQRKQPIQFDFLDASSAARVPGNDARLPGTKIAVLLQVAGAGDYLPTYAGNLDIMTSAALRTAERLVEVKAQVVLA